MPAPAPVSCPTICPVAAGRVPGDELDRACVFNGDGDAADGDAADAAALAPSRRRCPRRELAMVLSEMTAGGGEPLLISSSTICLLTSSGVPGAAFADAGDVAWDA